MTIKAKKMMGRPPRPPAKKPLRWGDLEDEDDVDLGPLATPATVIEEAFENGVKKVVSYRVDEQERRVKVTTTIVIRKLAQARLSKRAVERRSWRKFGDASREDDGSRLTVASTEEIVLERPRVVGSKADDIMQTKSGDPLAQAGGAVLMVCRTCGKKGDHWTAKCPYKDLAHPPEALGDKPPTSETVPNAAGAKKSTYVPPSQRAGAERSAPEVRRRNDENSVRVTNLSEDTREPDLEDLFSTFGPVTRVYIAYDQKTGASRGFGFVNFVHRGDAEKAIAKLNGYGYDSLILGVEWAAPRPN